MTPKARWLYLKLRYFEVPKIIVKAHFLKAKKIFLRPKPVTELVKINEGVSV